MDSRIWVKCKVERRRWQRDVENDDNDDDGETEEKKNCREL